MPEVFRHSFRARAHLEFLLVNAFQMTAHGFGGDGQRKNPRGKSPRNRQCFKVGGVALAMSPTFVEQLGRMVCATG